jgi:hypothetical protein
MRKKFLVGNSGEKKDPGVNGMIQLEWILGI